MYLVGKGVKLWPKLFCDALCKRAVKAMARLSDSMSVVYAQVAKSHAGSFIYLYKIIYIKYICNIVHINSNKVN